MGLSSVLLEKQLADMGVVGQRRPQLVLHQLQIAQSCDGAIFDEERVDDVVVQDAH